MYPAGSSPALLYATVVGPLSVRWWVAGRGLPLSSAARLSSGVATWARYERRPLAGVPLHHASFPWSGATGEDTRFPARPVSGRDCPPVRSVACSQHALT